MKRFLHVAMSCLLLAISVPAGGEDGTQKPVLRLAVDLEDGSHVLGLPATASLKLRTPFAELDVPLARVVELTQDVARASWVAHLANGDVLTGTLDIKSIELTSQFGPVSIPVSMLKRVAVVGGGGAAGLVLYYPFDGDRDGKVIDRSGHGHHGAVAGDVRFEPSFKGTAARFTARNSYIVCPDEELNVNGWRQVTVSAWIQYHHIRTYGCIVSRGEVTGEGCGGMALFAGGINGPKWYHNIFRLSVGGEAVDVNGSGYNGAENGYPTVGRWYHLVGTYDGKKLCLYIDGALNQTREYVLPDGGITDPAVTKLVIGTDGMRSRITTWEDVFFDGLVDEVRIYNRALSKEEVDGLYREFKVQAGEHARTGPFNELSSIPE